jgi:hypothetical protein
MRKRWIGWVVMLVMSVFGSPAQSQDTKTKATPWHTAYLFGLPSFDGEVGWPFMTFGVSVTRMANGTLSPDFSIGTVPMALFSGFLPVGVRAGLALPMQANSGSYVVPSAGLSAISVFGGGDTGINAGFALVSKKGERVGITWHRFGGSGAIMLIEVGGGPFSRSPSQCSCGATAPTP